MLLIKRIVLVLLIAIIIIPVCYFSFILFIGPALNDAKAAYIEKELLQIAFPTETEIIETASYCGHLYTTGNNVDIWAGVLIRSRLQQKEIFQFYRDNEIVWAVPMDENLHPEPSSYMRFRYLDANGDRENCYIIADHYEPVTQNDFVHGE